MNKDAKKAIAAITKMDDEIDGSTPLDVHHDISAVIRALREASAVSTSIFQSVLLFLSVPVSKPKPSRWSLVSKLVQNGRVACEYNTCNLETLEAELEDIENTMQSIFRYHSSCLCKVLTIPSKPKGKITSQKSCRSHPNIQKVEEELTKLKTLQVSATPEAATISSGLLGLEQLYKCMDGLLNLPQTLQALSQNQNKKWVDGLLEKSVRRERKIQVLKPPSPDTLHS
nr:uncharacterized protein LOC109167537 [Ipomoea batatas]